MNSLFHVRTKHIEVNHHYIREKVLSGEIELVPITTNDQIVDIFTKALAVPKFKKFRSMLRICTRESAMRGMLKSITDLKGFENSPDATCRLLVGGSRRCRGGSSKFGQFKVVGMAAEIGVGETGICKRSQGMMAASTKVHRWGGVGSTQTT
ncbi:hypothetical protein V2J09_000461 [Rumex salicifolius]